MEKTTFIYALCEPGTRTVRYIGKSNNPALRFKQHLCQSSRTKTHLGNWLRSVISLGETPALVVLREVPDAHREIAEKRYIRLAKGLGMRLVNSTDGGECCDPTPETRAKISAALTGVPKSPGHCVSLSISHRGLKRTPDQKAKISSTLRRTLKSRPPSPASTEHVAKRVAAAHTPEANEKRRKSLTGVPQSSEHVAKRVAAIKLSRAAKI